MCQVQTQPLDCALKAKVFVPGGKVVGDPEFSTWSDHVWILHKNIYKHVPKYFAKTAEMFPIWNMNK